MEYAAQHFLKLEINFWRSSGQKEMGYDISLPAGMITTNGYTSHGGDTDGDSYDNLQQVYGWIMSDMEDLVMYHWIPVSESDKA